MDLTPAVANSLLAYDAETGLLRWKVSPSNRIQAGEVAGSISGNGYRLIGVCGCRIKASRLIWFMIYGYWPKIVDHRNRNRADDRLCNLREARTESENHYNVATHKNNQSGYKGVYWEGRRKRWTAEIRCDGKKIWLGRFDTPEKAHQVYVEAAQKLHGEFACFN